MIALISIVSFVALAVSLIVPGFKDLLLLAAPCALAGLWLWLQDWRKRRRSLPGAARPQKGTYVIVDGSNVMHWQGNTPALETVVAVVQALEARGLTPGVMFDANAGYKIGDRYLGDRSLADRLGLPEDQVFVAPKGTPADKVILSAARRLQARVVTNDRYRDWAEEFPEVATAKFLMRGGIRDGVVWLERT